MIQLIILKIILAKKLKLFRLLGRDFRTMSLLWYFWQEVMGLDCTSEIPCHLKVYDSRKYIV